MTTGLSFFHLGRHLTPLSGHGERQFMQPTQRLKSTSCVFGLMHSALQTAEHFPQLLQVVLSSSILKSEIPENSPRSVPTGQTVLQ
jgi:hypothetical protein